MFSWVVLIYSSFALMILRKIYLISFIFILLSALIPLLTVKIAIIEQKKRREELEWDY